MSDVGMPWPPLIVVRKSFWLRMRDFMLTTVMWIVFIAMLESEFDLLFGSYLDQLGIRPTLRWIGFDDLSAKGSFSQFGLALVPYLGVAWILIVSLASFSIDTVLRRRKALWGPPAAVLPQSIEARHAELSTMTGHVGESEQALRADLDLGALDMRSLLVALNRLDDAALADARALRIVNVHLTTDGHYRIQAAE